MRSVFRPVSTACDSVEPILLVSRRCAESASLSSGRGTFSVSDHQRVLSLRMQQTDLCECAVEDLAGDPIEELREGLYDDGGREVVKLKNEKSRREKSGDIARGDVL